MRLLRALIRRHIHGAPSEEVGQAIDNDTPNLIPEQPPPPQQNEPQPMSGAVHGDGYVWYDPDLWLPTDELYDEDEESGHLNGEDTRQVMGTSHQIDDPTEDLLPLQPPAPEPTTPQRHSRIGTFIGGFKLDRAREDDKQEMSERVLGEIEAELALLDDLVETINTYNDDTQNGTRDTWGPHRGANGATTPGQKAKVLYIQLDALVGVHLGPAWDLCASARAAALLEKARLVRELDEAQRELDQLAREARICKEEGSRFKIPEFKSDVLKARRAVAARRAWALRKKIARHQERLGAILTVDSARGKGRDSRIGRIYKKMLV
ncbi:hypothetical protein GQX73_g4453 [Xylaria multiplex]|uniref:Uncharacterized protein n=1 Tax=Xylaria multiplex TaxID=323545 RepID=A0A7C8MTJ5_9PEZI|nr:hypothetical protein GQX73_g4453 [Xylaria multiplex]